MPTVLHRDSVVVRHPNAGGFSISVARGDEFAEDDPIVAAYPWLFVEPPVAPGPIVTEVKIPQKAAGKK